MNPIEIITKLQKLKTNNSRGPFLGKIPVDNEFWSGCYYSRPEVTFPYKFVITDPPSYGLGVKPGIFKKIVEGMIAKTLSENEFVIALNQFSKACTEEQWKSWYSKILSKTLDLPVDPNLFNQYAPEEFKILAFDCPQFTKFKADLPLPQYVIIEPYINAPRIFWFVHKDGLEALTENGDSIETPFHEIMAKIPTSDEGLVIESYLEDGLLSLRDICQEKDFLRNKETASLKHRKQFLDNFYWGLFGGNQKIRIVDYHIANVGTPEIRNAISMIFEQGFSGIVIRDYRMSYFIDNSIVVIPDKEISMKCIDIKKWTNKDVVEYVVGEGLLGKRNVISPIYHGLTLDARKQILEQRETFIGKNFTALCCGIGPDGKLMFPIFKKWS